MTYASSSIALITNPAASGATGHIGDHNEILAVITAHDNILSNSTSLAAAIADETGSGSLVFNTSPTFTGTVSASNVTLTGNLTASAGNVYLSSTSSAGGLPIVTSTGSQTLTNKTLTTPTISTIVNTGSLTLPTVTDTLVARTPTDILTNKSLSSASINAGSFSGNITNTATISGGTFTIATASALTLSAGTSASAPLFMTSGTNLTTPAAGAIEYDGKTFYATTNTSASSRGIVPVTLFTSNTGTVSLTSNTSAQSIFPATNDTITLVANTTYEMEMWLSISTASSTAHNLSVGFAIGGTLTSIGYMTNVALNAISAVTSTALNNLWIATNAAINISTSTNGATFRNVLVKGLVRSGTSGTFIPQVTFSVAPVTPVVAINSYLKLTPLGTDVVLATTAWS